MLKLYDSLDKKLKPFKPVSGNEVKLYVCGVTPYSTDHIGHIFVFTIFDSLIRFLKFQGYDVTYVQNVTDVDDPLFDKAREKGESWQEISKYWVDYMLGDFKFLNINMPDHFVYASEQVEKMIEIIEKLLKNGFAYTKDGNTYFEIEKFKEYGKLSDLWLL